MVYKEDSKAEASETLYKIVKQFKGGSGIIYVGTQNEAEDAANKLKALGISCAPYHAGFDGETRSKVHKRWLSFQYHVIVATVAFGMGIDKPDVRFIVHYTVPRSLEGLYQETGRAGRNGDRADCILIAILFSLGDWLRNYASAESSRQEALNKDVLKYCVDFAT